MEQCGSEWTPVACCSKKDGGHSRSIKTWQFGWTRQRLSQTVSWRHISAWRHETVTAVS